MQKKDLTKRETEEKWFAEQEQKNREKLRATINANKEAQKNKKCSTWMKCPKCGDDLEEIHFEDVCIDKCKGCKGIYLDDGELELLLDGRKAKGFISKFMKSMSGE